MNNAVAILIIFFNKLTQTIECIDSFLPAGQKIYVLNNASDKESWRVLKAKYEKNELLHFVNSDLNVGPSRGRNLLLDACTEEWLFLVDNDTRIETTGWMKILSDKMMASPGVNIFSPAIFNLHEDAFAQQQHFIKKGNTIEMIESQQRPTNYFTCCAIIINRQIFNTYGNFDSGLFAFEDYEFSIRALCSDKGELAVHDLPEISVIHDHRMQSSKPDRTSVLQRYDEKKIQSSLQHIMDKHQVIFEHNWQWWTRRQVASMTTRNIFQKIAGRLAGLLQKS